MNRFRKKADDAYLGDKYTDNAMFKDQTASITYVNNIPVVTIRSIPRAKTRNG
jgi:hypothetical protein